MEMPSAAKASLALLLLTFALVPSAGAEDRRPAAAAGPGAELWITLGQDVFDQLRREPGALGPGLGLESHAAEHGVVMTRVAAGSLEALSRYLHAKVDRCPGFMVHESREEAAAALAAARSGVAGTPLPVELVIDQQATVRRLLPMIVEDKVLSTIGHLSTAYANRFYESPAGEESALWIRDLWAGYAGSRLGAGVTVEAFDHSGYLQPSVILTIEGSQHPEQIVVLGGHLDSIGWGGKGPAMQAPGADDNASGIASLSEALRVLLAANHRPERTIKFMGYAAEEVGLRGSREIAAAHAQAGELVVAVLQLDMTAYRGSAEDVALVDDYTSAPLNEFVGELLDAYQPEVLWTTSSCGYACSDHASWYGAGYPVAMPHEAKVPQNNQLIHTTGDNLATLGNSAAHAVKFARLALTFAIEAGSGGKFTPPPALFADGFESADTTAWSLAVP